MLGDESQPNDFPSVYVNAPLEPGTQYTVFLWGFVPSVDGVSHRLNVCDSVDNSFDSPMHLLPRVRLW